MLTLISPAKKLDFAPVAAATPFTEPAFMDDAKVLVKRVRALSRGDLARLMSISDTLAQVNYERFKAFSTPFTPDNAKQAVLAFKGDTYVGLDAETLSRDDLQYAQEHLAILSGLYGLLRPLDLMQPYRLEMGARLDTPRGATLYDFWGDRITAMITASTKDHDDRTVINLASKEYFKAVNPKELPSRVVTPDFKQEKDGALRPLGMMTKRARGAMARYVIRNRIEDPENIKAFDEDGFRYRPDLSRNDAWLFVKEAG
jgi:cytoplasmic iron level regulating protein YaaA (DUF328/UPF0246 family)